MARKPPIVLTLRIPLKGGTFHDVEATPSRVAGLVLHRGSGSAGGWTATHLASGRAVLSCRTRAILEARLRKAEVAVPGVDWTQPMDALHCEDEGSPACRWYRAAATGYVVPEGAQVVVDLHHAAVYVPKGADTLVYVDAQDGRGSLAGIGAADAVPRVNSLDREQLLAVVLAVRSAPFALGAGRDVYGKALEAVRTAPGEYFKPEALTMPLVDLRVSIVQRSMDGMNAPFDSYLRVATDPAATY